MIDRRQASYASNLARMKDSRLVARLIDQVLDGSVYQKTSALDSIRFESCLSGHLFCHVSQSIVKRSNDVMMIVVYL